MHLCRASVLLHSLLTGALAIVLPIESSNIVTLDERTYTDGHLVNGITNLTIQYWAAPVCQAPLGPVQGPKTISSMIYNHNVTGTIISYVLDRDLQEDEVLDFSHPSENGDDLCGRFWRPAVGRVGHECWTLDTPCQCFRFWHR